MKSLTIAGCIILFTIGSVYAQSTEKEKEKVVKKTVTTYEEVDGNQVPGSEKKEVTIVSQNNDSNQKKLHLDLLAGAAKPTVGDFGDMLETRFGYGAQALYSLTPEFSLGGFYTTNNGEFKNQPLAEFRITYYGLVAQYKFGSTFFVQGRVGLSSLEATVSKVNATFKADENPVIAGLGFGVDLPITELVSFAPFVSYTNSFKAGSGTVNEVESYGLIEAMAALRFNF